MNIIAQEVHRQSRKPKEYRKVEVSDVNDIWSMDLVEMQNFEKENKGYKYLLTCIDLFSRYAWVEPLKNKTGVEVMNAIKRIFESANAKPNKIWVDEGSEFYNKDVKGFLKNIELYSTYGKAKASIIERFNRTFKGMMYKTFTIHMNHKWVKILNDLILLYNNKKHRGIGNMTPNEIYTKKPTKIQNVDANKKMKKLKFKIGDRVRISYSKAVFDKGYYPNYTDELYKIKAIKSKIPPMYSIEDSTGEEIKGSFYESEMVKTQQKEDVYLIEKVIETKKINGKKMALVKWLGYKEPTWEPEKSIQALREFDKL